MEPEIEVDMIDSIRLKRRNQRGSVFSIDYQSSMFVECSSIANLCDLDIDALDEEFKQTISELQNSMSDLRADPDNPIKRQSVLRTRDKLNNIKEWTSKLNTEEGRRLLDEQRKDVEKRKYEIDQVLKVIKAQSEVDICFMMDCTGSMKRTAPRLAFIGYRDVDYKENNLLQLNFTTDTDAFREYLEGVRPIPGADLCADVISGLEAVSTLEWSNPNRVLVHVCDAPCHGKNYYDQQKNKKNWDHYPGGDPLNRDIYKILLDIKRQNIQYFSVQLNKYTEKMFQEFQVIYGPIFQLDVKNSDELMKNVAKITTATINTMHNETMSVFKTTEQRKSYVLSDIIPDWNVMNTYPILIVEFLLPKTIEDLFHPLFEGTSDGTMQIAPNPFARGSLRYAYYGRLASSDSQRIDVVYKELISADPRFGTLIAYKQHLEIHTIAQFLADLFNQAQKKVFRKPVEIVYAEASIVQQMQDKTKIYQVEARFKQTIQKWNYNCGGVHFEAYSTTLQVFSHWTYHQTAGRIMIVDLQGVKSSEDNAYLLTDPAIHFDDISRCKEARTNLGVKGMREFFRTHVCSQICHKLGLDKVTNDIDEDTANEFYKSDQISTLTGNLEDNSTVQNKS